MSNLCTLEQLRDHAAKNPDTEYNLDSCGECLAAQLTGREMWDNEAFAKTVVRNPVVVYKTRDDEATVPRPFAEFCRAVPHRRPLAGRVLAEAIQGLIDGAHPRDVAEQLRTQ